MITFALQSGSSGNCYFYQSGDVKLLFDAGISWRCAADRLRNYGIAPDGFRGIFISHEHSDHTCAAGVFQRKLQTPLFMSAGTHRGCHSRLGKTRAEDIVTFKMLETVCIGHVQVQTIPTPHDAAEPCAFIIDDGFHKVGIFTDLGHVSARLRREFCDLDMVYLESNYDSELLKANPLYPPHLKMRITGGNGHLENSESADLVLRHCSDRTKTVVLCHLSGDNNNPGLALATHRRIVAGTRNVAVAPRNGPSSYFQLKTALPRLMPQTDMFG